MDSHQNRKLLDKLLRSKDVRREHRALMTEMTASRFVQGVRGHEDPVDVLFQLNRADAHLIRTIFTLGSSNSFMDVVVMPFLAWLAKDALSIGTCSKRQQSICSDLARAPGVLDRLLEALSCDEIADELALVWFLERLVLDDGSEGAEARASSVHLSLAKRLTRSLSPPVKVYADRLLKVLQDPAEMAKRNEEIASTGAASGGGMSLEAIQESQPGGRHSNDHADFRSVIIVPSVDEVQCQKLPFLPTPKDADASHIDRQFRLLRHDMVSSVTEAVEQLQTLRTKGGGKGKETGRGGGGSGGGRPPLVLPVTKRGAVIADNGGGNAAVLIHFDWPRDHPVSRMSPNKRRGFLQQAKGGRGGHGSGSSGGAGRNLLRRDSLVALTDKSFNPLIFGNITIRDEALLAGGGESSGDGSRGGGGGGGGGRGRGNRHVGGQERGNRGMGGPSWGNADPPSGNTWRSRQESRPAIGISFFSRGDLESALLLSRDESWGCLVPLSVSVFAYEAVLNKMQSMVDVPMGISGRVSTETPKSPQYKAQEAEAIEQVAARFAPSPSDLEQRVPLMLSSPLPGVNLPSGCQFDVSQRVAVANVLRQEVGVVQGPPGTGKTFLGVLLAQILLSSTTENILCVCYTNHALDSLLEDLLAKGITSMVRIGGGSKNSKLDAFRLRDRQAAGFNRVQNRQFAHLKNVLEESGGTIDNVQHRLNSKPDKTGVLRWLEDEHPEDFAELQLPEALGRNGDTVVANRGRALTGASIVQSWLQGKPKPLALQPESAASCKGKRRPSPTGIWALDKNARKAAWDTWEGALRKEAAEYVARKIEAHDSCARELSELQRQRDLQRVKGVRIVGCTTTGAAIHHAVLSEARCGIVLVEEAAEVLEAHVLTALAPFTKHLIMIGDHKQLRPKVEKYDLQVESGRGFDLNVSLFERLVKNGYPHTTLELQHRMPPEISALVRGLTYPGLRDGPGTTGRPHIRGVRDRVCFVAHNHNEETAASMRQRQDDGASASKVNMYEVEMVSKTVQYLLLQGYDPDEIVVLTPYLAQLRELREALDGTVSDQDASDLAAAMKQGGGQADQGGKRQGNGRKGGEAVAESKSRVRIATVDNYQGEENDVVIGSFVRSNAGGQMGFVGDPNRLNVAISRARHGMILFGDLDFFTSDIVRNKSGQRLWLGFRSLLESGGHVYTGGLPVVCEIHKTNADLSTPGAFDTHVPDGGCRVVCGAKLACDGHHPCPRRCHPRDDPNHEKISCAAVVEEMCPKGHILKRRCSQDATGTPCRPCEREAVLVAREISRQAEGKRRREDEREAATVRLAEARRFAALEREKLSHERELLNLEKETQRVEVDAERTKSIQGRVRTSLKETRTSRGESNARVENGTAASKDSASSHSSKQKAATKQKNDNQARTTDTTPGGKRGISPPSATAPGAPTANATATMFTSASGVPIKIREKGVPNGLKGSTLLRVAQAASDGNAQGIVDALNAIPRAEREQSSHELAVAVGELAHDWFPPSRGGEPAGVPPPGPRTVQAMGMMSSGEWVKARTILAAVVQEEAKRPTGSQDPSALYALGLCDHHIGGASVSSAQLAALAAAESRIWPGPPDHRPPPDGWAFPLGALVQAHLEAVALTPAASLSGGTMGIDTAKVRACSLAVSFLRAPVPARKAGNVDSPVWTEAAEAVVKSTGAALAVALWGPEGGDYGDKAGGGGGGKDEVANDGIEGQWRRLQSKWGIFSEAMDELFELSGLDAIKADFLGIAKSAIIDTERGYDLASRSFNVRLEGNPGTGKTTVARLYYRLLKDLGVFASAEEKARSAKEAADAEAKKKADAAEKAKQDQERRLFQSAGLSYNVQNPTSTGGVPAPAPAPPARSAAASAARGFVETTGADLADQGVAGLKGMLKTIKEAGGGVLFVDEAYTLEPQGGGGGKQVLNFLLAEIENRRGELVVAFAGYPKNMETLFEFNDGLPSRFPKILKFEDYSDALLFDIFKGLMGRKKGRGTLCLAPGAGEGERWAKVAIARLGRQRGSRGFGNARAVRVLFDQVVQRQANRLSGEDDAGADADLYELQKSDLLGTSVTNLDDSADWRTLRDMIGLTSVKEAVRALAEVVKTNLVLEEACKPLRNVALNRCMLGNPGTGKTTVAKLFAGVLTDLGLLSKGEVVLKTASDFVGSVLGESESKTRAILKASEGCVLVIDEAYSLSAAGAFGGGGTGGGDPYRTAVVDTLVEQVQNVPGEDRCVLLLGYRAEMEAFMKSTNPGLARRFPLDNSLVFEDYTDEELLCILRGKLHKEQLEAGIDALMAAARVLRQKRSTASHFGNGGEVANLLSEAKLRKENRRGDGSVESRLDPELIPQDFDPEHGVGTPDSATLEDELFGDLIGCNDIRQQLRNVRSTFVHAQRLGRDPRETINLNFRFTGAPGTGKTTVAQRVGRMFKQLGVIHSDEVVSCSPSDFTTGYVGQSALKTKEILNKAIGKVLFIDEAYGLNPRHGGGSGYMQEVVDQLVQCLTDDTYKGNMVVVLAGYADDIDQLMEANPGLASRFPETLHFPNFTVDDCCRLLESALKRGFSTELAPDAAATLPDILAPLVQAPRFGNGRSMTDLAKRVFTEIGVRINDGQVEGSDATHDDPRASAGDIRRSTAAILRQMATSRAGTVFPPSATGGAPPAAAFSTSSERERAAPKAASTAKIAPASPQTKTSETNRALEESEEKQDEGTRSGGDAFLSEEDRNTLEKASEIAGIPLDSPDLSNSVETNESLRRALLLPRASGGIGFSAQETHSFLRKVVADRTALSNLGWKNVDAAETYAAGESAAQSAVTEAEAAVERAATGGGDEELLALLMSVKRTKEMALKKAKEDRERELAFEQAAQAALRRLGVCPAGFQWMRQGNGWRCSAGGHFVSGETVAAELAHGKSP